MRFFKRAKGVAKVALAGYAVIVSLQEFAKALYELKNGGKRQFFVDTEDADDACRYIDSVRNSTR